MATRQEIQIAQDLIRFVNVMNDLLDSAAYILREIDPHTGDPYRVQDPFSTENRVATLDEIKATITRLGKSVLGYWNMLASFKLGYGELDMDKALKALGVNANDIVADISTFKTEAQYLSQNIGNVINKTELIPYADRLDANVPKLRLVRRSWNL
ncbi:MAG: hypothetical protein JSW07_18160 [bacterium]|nr:MAG: hypothetical protein JSW07_18160 [bacterium]